MAQKSFAGVEATTEWNHQKKKKMKSQRQQRKPELRK